MNTQPLSHGRGSPGALAISEFLHKGFQNFAHGAQISSPATSQHISGGHSAQGQVQSSLLVPAPFSQIHNPTHSASPKITVAVSQTNSDTGEIGNVPKTIGQAHD